MMTKTPCAQIRAWINRLITTFIFLFPSSVYALKVQQLSPFQLIARAQVVVAVDVTLGEGPWDAAVIEVIKAPSGETLPDRIKFNAFSMTDADRPKFIAGEKRILFLTKNGNDVYQCLSYGKQAVWPKNQIEWPYNKDHISTFEDALSAFRHIQTVSIETNELVGDKFLADLLKRNNLLLKSLAAEFLSEKSKEHYSLSRAVLAGTSQINPDQYLESQSPKLITTNRTRSDEQVKSTPIETKENQPIQVLDTPRDSDARKALSTIPSVPGKETAASTPWSIFVILIVVASGMFWLLLKRRS